MTSSGKPKVAGSSADPTNKIAQCVAACAALIVSGDTKPPTVAITLPGGWDPATLLHAYAMWRDVGARVQLVALHIHHGLCVDVDVWECACRRVAQAVGVTFHARRANVAVDAGRGVEETAREAWYTALEVLCTETGASILLTAHHQDDQAETVLLQLMRGAGLDGLVAMPMAWAGAVTSLYPRVDASCSEIESYAHAHALCWVEDPPNTDARYARNASHPLLAGMVDHFPVYRKALSCSVAYLADTAVLIDETAQADLSQVASANELNVAALSALSALRQRVVLRAWLVKAGMRALSSRRPEDLHMQLVDARNDDALRIELPIGQVRRCRGIVWIGTGTNNRPGQAVIAIGAQLFELAHPAEQCVAVDVWGGVLLFAPVAGDGVATQTLQASLVLSPRHGGERIVLRPGGPPWVLKQVYQEVGTPAWERQRLPLLYAGEMLVFAVGLGMNQAATHSGTGWCIMWYPGL